MKHTVDKVKKAFIDEKNYSSIKQTAGTIQAQKSGLMSVI